MERGELYSKLSIAFIILSVIIFLIGDTTFLSEIDPNMTTFFFTLLCASVLSLGGIIDSGGGMLAIVGSIINVILNILTLIFMFSFEKLRYSNFYSLLTILLPLFLISSLIFLAISKPKNFSIKTGIVISAITSVIAIFYHLIANVT